jgi:hypothetical protein
VHPQAELLEVIETLTPPGSLTGGLDGRQEEADEGANDGDDDEQFNERERPSAAVRHGVHGLIPGNEWMKRRTKTTDHQEFYE